MTKTTFYDYQKDLVEETKVEYLEELKRTQFLTSNSTTLLADSECINYKTLQKLVQNHTFLGFGPKFKSAKENSNLHIN